MVNISGGEVNGDVFGGGGWSKSLTTAGVATGNFVDISGGMITGNVYGGEGYNYEASGEATATWNTVTISGSPVFGAGTELYGGIAWGQGDDFTGNTLNVRTSGLTVHGLYNFERLNFFLPQGLSGGATVLTVTDVAAISGSAVEVEVAGSASPLALGDEVILIDAGTLSGSPANWQTSGLGSQGVSLLYEFDLLVDGNRLKAVVAKTAINERARALSEGLVAGLGLLSLGADLIEGQGLDGAWRAGVRGAALNGAGWLPFWAFSASQSRLESGSHVDIGGFSVLAGVAKRFEVGGGALTAGPFLEYGRGSYDTYNSFASSLPVHGDGQASHSGGGLLARLDLPGGPNILHFELSARAGRLRNEFGSQDLRSLAGVAAAYGYSAPYYGLHAGAGYLLGLGEATSLDMYARYLWTRQKGSETALSTGERARFDDADSSRLRLGARVTASLGEKASVHAGAAWEHEFDGLARASLGGREVEPPSIKGDAGIGELGLTMMPAGGFSVDLNLKGFVGKRKGGTASLFFRLEF
jgi:outer membrane autotransporter protein